MLPGEPVLTVLFYSFLAAVVAALGALPFAFGRRPRTAWVGAAYALAGGLMLGSGNLLMTRDLGTAPLLAFFGAALGVAYTYWRGWRSRRSCTPRGRGFSRAPGGASSRPRRSP